MELGAIGLALVWMGATGGNDPVWSEAGHWNPATVPPGAAVALEFPAEHAGFNGNDIDLSGSGPLEIRIQGAGYHIIADEPVPTCGIDASYTSGFSRVEFDIIPHADCDNLEYRVAGSAELRNNDNSPPPGMDIVKSGTGTLRFHTFSPVVRGVTVEAGAVVFQATWPATTVLMESGVVAGAGRVGSLSATGGTVSPGGNIAVTDAPATPGAGAGTLLTGSVSLGPGSTFDVELNGVGNSDLLSATGIVTLNNPTLSATLGFTPDPGGTTVIPIITNSNPAAVVGTFAGLPEGAEFTLGGRRASITYVGGTGNEVQITIHPVGAILDVAPATLPAMTEGTAVSQTISASGGATPYTFEVIGGTLPPGLSLSEAGALTGTPTAAGAYSFTVEATDSVGNTGTQGYSGTIAAAPEEITIESPELPAITAGAPFSFQLEIDGGVAPYTCEVTGGALPAGITLDDECLLSGTATEPGEYSFTITVTDSADAFTFGTAAMFATATFTFTGTVAAAVPSMPAFALGILAVMLIAVGTWGRGWGG